MSVLFCYRQINGHRDEHKDNSRYAGGSVWPLALALLGGRLKGAPGFAEVLQGLGASAYRERPWQKHQREYNRFLCFIISVVVC